MRERLSHCFRFPTLGLSTQVQRVILSITNRFALRPQRPDIQFSAVSVAQQYPAVQVLFSGFQRNFDPILGISAPLRPDRPQRKVCRATAPGSPSAEGLPHRHAPAGQVFLHLPHGKLPVMEQGRRQRRICAALRERVVEMIQLPRAAGGDDGNLHRL